MDRSSFALLLSLIAHALIAWLIWLTPPPAGPPPGATEVSYVDPTDAPRLPRRERLIDQSPAKPDDAVKPEDLHDASALISNLNRRYKRQMIARRRGPEVKAPTGPAKNEPRLQADHLTGAPARERPPEPRDGELALPRFGGASKPKQPLFAPASTGQRVPWVEFGDLTVLNSDRHTYFTFYERMGEQVGNRWVSLVYEMVARTPRERLEKMARADRLTRVEITLDANGDFKGARFESKSGFDDLDYTGVEAFRMATPFVNPPRGMVGPDNLIHIHVAFEVIMRPPVFAQPGF